VPPVMQHNAAWDADSLDSDRLAAKVLRFRRIR
jgi:hypothetical protein